MYYQLGSSLVWQQCGSGAFTRECGFSTIVWLLLSKQSEKSGIPTFFDAATVHLTTRYNPIDTRTYVT